MSSDPTWFIQRVDAAPTYPDSMRILLEGIAEEIEARVTSQPSLKELAERLRTDGERITDAVLSNIGNLEGGGDGQQRSTPQDDGYQEAVEFVMAHGYTPLAAEAMVQREGIITIITAKKREEAERVEQREGSAVSSGTAA